MRANDTGKPSFPGPLHRVFMSVSVEVQGLPAHCWSGFRGRARRGCPPAWWPPPPDPTPRRQPCVHARPSHSYARPATSRSSVVRRSMSACRSAAPAVSPEPHAGAPTRPRRRKRSACVIVGTSHHCSRRPPIAPGSRLLLDAPAEDRGHAMDAQERVPSRKEAPTTMLHARCRLRPLDRPSQ
jgi:hypothetical protein